MKAKSRLKNFNIKQEPELGGVKVKTRQSRFSKNKINIFIKYFKHLPALLISLPFYFIIYYIFTKIKPDQIRHFIIPNTYLPLQVPLFLANFFFFSFIFLKSRRGFLISLFIFLNLFLKLQGVLTVPIFFIILTPVLVFELIATVIDR